MKLCKRGYFLLSTVLLSVVSLANTSVAMAQSKPKPLSGKSLSAKPLSGSSSKKTPQNPTLQSPSYQKSAHQKSLSQDPSKGPLKNSSKKLTISLLADNVAFISEDYENTDHNVFSLLGVKLYKEVDLQENQFDYGINLAGYYGVNSMVLSHLRPQELFIAYSWKNIASYNMYLGRKKLNWSTLDETWSLGFYQPQFRWNSLDLETQGLPGLFYNVQYDWDKRKSVNYSLFVSSLYVPDQGPGFEINNGRFLNTNPWFQVPPSRVEFQGEVFPIDYQVEMPKMKDIIFQSSYGALLRFENGGYFMQASAMNKPSHQLAMGFKGALVADKVKADILPKTYRETLYGFDIGYKEKCNEASLSFVSVNPETTKFEDPYTYPIMSSSFAWGPKLSYGLGRWQVIGAGLFTSGAKVDEAGPDAGTITTPLTYKYVFHSGYKVGIIYKNNISKDINLNTKVEWQETFDHWSKMLKFKSIFDLKGPWSFTLDLMLIETGSEPSSLSNTRNLDQIWLGALYEF